MGGGELEIGAKITMGKASREMGIEAGVERGWGREKEGDVQGLDEEGDGERRGIRIEGQDRDGGEGKDVGGRSRKAPATYWRDRMKRCSAQSDLSSGRQQQLGDCLPLNQ